MLTNTIINIIHKYPKRLISFITLFVLVAGTGVIKLEKEYSQKSWFRDGDPLLKDFDHFKDQYGSDISLITVLSFNSSVFKKENLLRAFQITEDFWTIPNFVRVDSLTNYSHTKSINDDITITPLVKDPSESPWDQSYLNGLKQTVSSLSPVQNYLISKDNKSIAIYSRFKHVEGHESQTFKDTVKDVREKIISKYQNDDLKIMLTGPAMVGTTFEEESIRDFLFIVPLALAILFFILTVLTRNFIATFIILGLICFTLLATLGIQGWLGIKIGLVTGMCPLIVLAICVADSIHIFTTYLKADKNSKLSPLKQSLQKNLYPTFLTTLTTMLGFISLCGAELYPISDMGIVSAIGIGLAWIFTVFLVCPLLLLVPVKSQLLARFNLPVLRFEKLHSFIEKYPKHIVCFVLMASSLAFYFSSQNKVDSNMLNYFGGKSEFRIATDFFEKNIGGTESIELIIKNQTDNGITSPQFLKKVETFTQKLYQIEDVTKVNSIIDPLKEVNQVLNGGKSQYNSIAESSEKIAQELFFLELSLPPTKNLNNLISRDKKEMRLSIFWTRSDSSEIMAGKVLIEKMLKQAGLIGHVTGTVPLISGLDGYIVESFFQSMAIAIVLISLLMMWVFKSVFFGLFSMIPNIIVPSFGAAALYAFGKPFDAGSILIFSICLGIAIDDTIFFLTNFRLAMTRNTSIRKALKEVLQNTGHTLTYTTFILVTVFGLFSLGSFIPNQNFALATSVILSSALLLDLIFLPSLLIFIDDLSLKFKRRT